MLPLLEEGAYQRSAERCRLALVIEAGLLEDQVSKQVRNRTHRSPSVRPEEACILNAALQRLDIGDREAGMLRDARANRSIAGVHRSACRVYGQSTKCFLQRTQIRDGLDDRLTKSVVAQIPGAEGLWKLLLPGHARAQEHGGKKRIGHEAPDHIPMVR